MYLTKKAKIIIGAVVGVLVLAGVIGGSIAISKAVKKNKQAKCEHVYDAGEIQTEATCETPGMIMYTCQTCELEKTEEIPANGHVETVIEAIPATCTAKGFTDGIQCVTCEKVLVAPVETPLLGHNPTSINGVAATCTTTGKTEGSVCSRCEEVLKEQTIISAKGHTVVELKGYAATCTDMGKTNGSKCSACGKVFSAQEDIPTIAHTDMNTDGICDVCNYTEVKTIMVWELCTDVAQLKAGDQIIIVAQSEEVALSATQNTSNRPAASITKNDTLATIGAETQVITLEAGLLEDTFAFNVGTGYLYASSSSNNQLKTQEVLSSNSTWKIVIDSDGVASIVAQGDSTRNVLMYNVQSRLFSCYETEQGKVVIYKLVEKTINTI